MKRILSYGPAVRAELASFIAAKRSAAAPDTPWRTDLLDRLLPFATAGKLLRGSLVCFSYELFARQPPDAAVRRAAAALELTHSALLIHDDIMDNDDIRRGQPALHRQYQEVGRRQGLTDDRWFGLSMAVCGGDATLFLAFELLAGVPAEKTARVTQLFVDHLIMVCAGQMQDMYFESLPGVPSKRAIHELMRRKTASYSLALPLAMGAALAGQPDAVLNRLRALGTAAGTIFQIRDDELGVMSRSETLGKPVGSDIRQGKKTLLYYYLWKRCNAADRRRLRASFGNPQLTPGDLAAVQKLVRHHDVPRALNDEIRRLTRQAERSIAQLGLDYVSTAELASLVAFCGQRQR